jgi:hypothetical protein
MTLRSAHALISGGLAEETSGGFGPIRTDFMRVSLNRSYTSMAHSVNVTKLAEQINEAAGAYRVGALQRLRGKLHGKRARTQKMFSKETIHGEGGDDYAYHDGGRTELQFNIGLELRDQQRCWRHGVAFSFERSQTLPDPRILRPKVGRFNIWVRSNADALHGFRMWDWGQTRSMDRPPGEILEEMLEDFMTREAFVFLGAIVPEAEVDVTEILQDFDRLYDLYEYIESDPNAGRSLVISAPQRRVSTATHTTASHLAAQIEVDLRHNLLQGSLVNMLTDEFPGCPVYREWKVVEGGRVDAAVDAHDGLLFCEIKVAPHVRAALREAIGQLLEYAHWPTECRAKRWWVVSEGVPSPEDVAYLQAVRTRYGLPVFYRRIDAEAGVLGPET